MKCCSLCFVNDSWSDQFFGHGLCNGCFEEVKAAGLSRDAVFVLFELRALQRAIGWGAEAAQRTASYALDLSQMQRRRDGVY